MLRILINKCTLLLLLNSVLAIMPNSATSQQHQTSQSTNFNIIPEPVQMIPGNGAFIMDNQTIIVVPAENAELKELAQTFSSWIAPAAGFTLAVKNKNPGSGKNIQLSLNSSLPGLQGDEGYKLTVTTNGIMLAARKAAGIFNGLQTLRQLLPAAVENSSKQNNPWSIPAVEVIDYPRFGWRGLLLDVSRHFFPKEFVKQYIDQMARYKFNVFHWHLTDDQGWRIEIKAFPKLTETGAWRVPRTGKWWSFEEPKKGEAASYGGFYTQNDIREIVAYARQRNITILPEIDVPGHSLAAIAAYPYLSATGYLYPVNPGSKFYQIQDNTLNPADERVYEFLNKVFDEVAALFPNEYVHIGGDECTKVFWRKSAQVQRFMLEKGIKTEDELQSYFIKRIEKILEAKGKKIIGWDEILEGGIAPGAAVMSWRGIEGGIKAAKEGHKVVMTPSNKVYLDLYQGDATLEPDTYSMLRLKTTYLWDPVPENIAAELILGGQGNLWTESIPGARHAEYMTWPRGLSLAEVFWSPKTKLDWQHFQQKLEPHFQRLEAANINYSRAAFDVLATATHSKTNQLLCTLGTDIDGLDIYYTFDDTNPDLFAIKYNAQPIEIPKELYQLRAVTYRDKKPSGKILIISREELEKRAGK